jgi:hypothetical protein
MHPATGTVTLLAGVSRSPSPSYPCGNVGLSRYVDQTDIKGHELWRYVWAFLEPVILAGTRADRSAH